MAQTKPKKPIKPRRGSNQDVKNRQLKMAEKEQKHQRRLENRQQSYLDRQQKFTNSRRNIKYKTKELKAGRYDDPIANRIKASGEAGAAIIGSTGGSIAGNQVVNTASPAMQALGSWNNLIDGNPDKSEGDAGTSNPSNNPGSILGG